jgi:hypothetical protein
MLEKGMLFGKKKRPPERYYLLPGQGGRNYYSKQRIFIRWAVGVSVVCGGAMAGLMWWWARARP